MPKDNHILIVMSNLCLWDICMKVWLLIYIYVIYFFMCKSVVNFVTFMNIIVFMMLSFVCLHAFFYPSVNFGMLICCKAVKCSRF